MCHLARRKECCHAWQNPIGAATYGSEENLARTNEKAGFKSGDRVGLRQGELGEEAEKCLMISWSPDTMSLFHVTFKVIT